MDEIRIIVTSDRATGPVTESKEDVERWARDYFARTGIDVVTFDLVGGDMCAYRSKVVETYPFGPTKKLADEGVDLPAILAEACHRNGLQYWPAHRVNTQRASTRFKEENPDCVLTATTFARPGLLDYGSPKVRRLMLRLYRELVEDYEADGLLLNFTRYWPLFHQDRWLECTPLLTEYMSEIRCMLDEVGRKKGRHIPLAAQVLARVPDCLHYSMDVKAWAQKGTVQYLLPSRPNNTDFNLPVEQFVEAAKGTNCRIFPVVHVSTRHPLGRAETRMTSDMFRAAAHLYYRAGAHGLATMNIGMRFSQAQQLRDPDLVARGPHHYRYSLNPYDSGEGSLNFLIEVPQQPEEGVQLPSTRKQLPFRLADDPASRPGGVLRFTVANLHPEDVLEIDLNGVPMPKTMLNGSAQHPRWPYEKQPSSELFNYLYEFPLAGLPVIQGENFLGFKIVSSAPGLGAGSRANPVVQEVEVIIP